MVRRASVMLLERRFDAVCEFFNGQRGQRATTISTRAFIARSLDLGREVTFSDAFIADAAVFRIVVALRCGYLPVFGQFEPLARPG